MHSMFRRSNDGLEYPHDYYLHLSPTFIQPLVASEAAILAVVFRPKRIWGIDSCHGICRSFGSHLKPRFGMSSSSVGNFRVFDEDLGYPILVKESSIVVWSF